MSYIYENGHRVLKLDGAGNRDHRYLYGPEVDLLFADEDSLNDVLWPLQDYQQSVRDLLSLDASDVATVDVHRSYGVYGTLIGFGFWQSNEMGYTGREWDAGAGLYNYRSRWLDPELGRFISEDTIGFEGGDPNLNRYVGNNPATYTDPSGHFSLSGFFEDLGESFEKGWKKSVEAVEDAWQNEWVRAGVYFAGAMAGAYLLAPVLPAWVTLDVSLRTSGAGSIGLAFSGGSGRSSDNGAGGPPSDNTVETPPSQGAGAGSSEGVVIRGQSPENDSSDFGSSSLQPPIHPAIDYRLSDVDDVFSRQPSHWFTPQFVHDLWTGIGNRMTTRLQDEHGRARLAYEAAAAVYASPTHSEEDFVAYKSARADYRAAKAAEEAHTGELHPRFHFQAPPDRPMSDFEAGRTWLDNWAIDPIAGWGTGHANVVTFGGSDSAQCSLYGDALADYNQSSLAYGIGTATGIGSSVVMGYGGFASSGSLAAGGVLRTGLQAWTIAGDVAGVGMSSYNVLSDQSSAWDALGFLPTVGWAGAGLRNVRSASSLAPRGANNLIRDVGDDVTKWLGQDATVIANEFGDTLFESADGLRQIRFDFNHPYPHRNPHSHLIEYTWVKNKKVEVSNRRIYPQGVTPE